MIKKLLTLASFILTALCVNAQNPNADLVNRLKSVDAVGYRMAIEDMKKSSPQLKITDEWKKSLETIEKEKPSLIEKINAGDKAAYTKGLSLVKTLDEILLQNPLLKGKELLVIERKLKNAREQMSGGLGLAPSNFQNNSEIGNPESGWNNRLVSIKDVDSKIKIEEVFKPTEGVIFSDLEPHFSGEKLMYSSIGTNDRWHLFELNLKTGEASQLTPAAYEEFDSFDGCYTPDGRYIFCATATFLGLPCTDGGNKMCGLFSYDPKTGVSRQLTFDQDSNWGPVVMDNGQILYQRWEYADLPHSNSRIMFTMNPDGTSQMAYYGSNSYFPTSLFGARPIPGSNGKFVGVIGGHHSVSRSGMLMIFDPLLGRKEADGVITEIPHRGRKVEPVVRDRQPDGIWPQFLHPFPLNEKYYVVSMKYSPESLWGVYLVDVYNNMTLIAETEDAAMLEPTIISKVATPSIIPDRIDVKSDSATVFVQDVYFGGGLKGVPRGEVKKLRIGSYDFSPLRQGGLLGTIGLDGPWDVKRIIGEVDVEEDGSAMFRVPANTAIFIQPLDSEGKALQVMRSWFTAMPGETLSCIGCHEERNTIAQPKSSIASRKAPQSIKPFQGMGTRGFSFVSEVQPILDRACVACHNGSKPNRPNFKGGNQLTDWVSSIAGRGDVSYAGKFTESYYQLQRYVRRPGIESDMDMLVPMDVHADQTELFQIINNGHYDVELTPDEVATLAVWVDFNAQFHGRRKDIPSYSQASEAYRLRAKYAPMFGVKLVDLEVVKEPKTGIEPFNPQRKEVALGDTTSIKGWPHYKAENINNYDAWVQLSLGSYQKNVDMGNGVKLALIKVPAGEFHMGSDNAGEKPITKQKIEKPFWIGRYEITNEQYQQFRKEHSSRDEHRHGYQFGRKGYPLSDDKQPVVRISWVEAIEFCEWLSEKTGLNVTLPTEKEWEWAARSGSNKAYSFGELGADYTKYANMGDKRLKEYAACTSYKFYESVRIIDDANRYDDWVPRDSVYDDGEFVSSAVGKYRPNAWDIYDMHGNVWEWTRSEYMPYPYQDNMVNDVSKTNVKRSVRGGSWYDRPFKATSSFRSGYRDYQPLFNVGFRVVVYED